MRTFDLISAILWVLGKYGRGLWAQRVTDWNGEVRTQYTAQDAWYTEPLEEHGYMLLFKNRKNPILEIVAVECGIDTQSQYMEWFRTLTIPQLWAKARELEFHPVGWNAFFRGNQREEKYRWFQGAEKIRQVLVAYRRAKLLSLLEVEYPEVVRNFVDHH